MALEDIDDIDAEALQTVATKTNLDALRTGKADPQLLVAAKRVDRLIADSPGLDGDKILYRGITGDGAKLRTGVGVTDAGYTVLTATKPTTDTVLAVKLLKGTKALEVDGHYLLPRGVTLELKPTAESEIPAVLASQIGGHKSLTASVSETKILFNAPQGDALEEFYNHAHGKGGKFAPAGGSSSVGAAPKGGNSSGAKVHSPRKAKRKVVNHAKGKRIAKDVAAGLAYIGIVALFTLSFRQTSVTAPPRARNAVKENNSRTARQHAGKSMHKEESASDWYERTLREKPIIR